MDNSNNYNKPNKLKTFFCIDYPGLVKNEQEAIRTLGGIDRIEQAFQRKSTKFLLNYTPDNIFSKMLGSSTIEQASDEDSNSQTTESVSSFSNNRQNNENDFGFGFSSNNNYKEISASNKFNDILTMPCLLMSIKTIKNENKRQIKNVQIVGKVKKIFNFQKIADFQYLPMNTISKTIDPIANGSSSGNNNTTNITFNAFYDNFLFSNIQSYEQDLKRNTLPLFVLPPFFSRFDDPVNYAFRSEPTKKKDNKSIENVSSKSPEKSASECKDDENPDSVDTENEIVKDNKKEDTPVIRSMRQERSSQAILVSFKTKNIPQNPSDKLKPLRNEIIQNCVKHLKELFNERPCYLKSVLLCQTNYPQSLLKEALPYCAYYFTTGPWRSCWVRFGYDPRKIPESKIYQMIDYRLRYYSEPEQKVKAKPRSSYHKRKFRSDLSENESDDYKNLKFDEDMYKFKADKLPASRNVFYQLCDIEDDDVQALIKSDDNRPTVCNEKDGWCTSNIQNKCRDLMSQKHEKLSKALASDNKKLKNNL